MAPNRATPAADLGFDRDKLIKLIDASPTMPREEIVSALNEVGQQLKATTKTACYLHTCMQPSIFLTISAVHCGEQTFQYPGGCADVSPRLSGWSARVSLQLQNTGRCS